MQIQMPPPHVTRYDSTLVVGAGIAGIQAALDLSEAGHHVFMIERSLYTGGMVVRLDKMFPTNDCSFCTLAPQECFLCVRSPRFIDYGGRARVDLVSGAELAKLDGTPGNFTATINEFPRYVDQDRCTACGKCAEVCPVKLDDEFNEGMSRRKAAFRPHPQSHPETFAIDAAACTRCGRCVEACPEQCIDLDMEERTSQLHVGAVILAPGFEPFRPVGARNLGYGIHPDVVTSIEFERLVSASGPTGGRLRRPSDGRVPERIAWIQCVGSRDPASHKGYCSTVCCMYAVKQAVLAHQSTDGGVNGTIFGMDLRAYGKGFHQYFRKAESKQGIRFVRSRVSEVGTGGGSLSIRYAEGPGRIRREVFDMVVLSVGLCAPSGAARLAEAAGIELNGYGFCKTPALSPVLTSRPGVFVAGSFSGPKDIPDTVTESSAAVDETLRVLGSGTASSWGEVRAHVEKDVSDKEPRVGVVLCRCGTRISDILSLPGLAHFASSLPDVSWVETLDQACSPEGQDALSGLVSGSDVNRVVVGACSPRSYELLFRDALQDAGLNGYMLEMANLLEQCALVHGRGAGTDTKARDLMRMAVGRARTLHPLDRPSRQVTTPAALVLGGGLAGLTCASALLDQGHPVYLVEKTEHLGGLAQQIESTLDGFPLSSHVKALADRVSAHLISHVFVRSRLESLQGEAGAFVARLRIGPQARAVDISVGAVVVATGGREYTPQEQLYGLDPRVVTSLQVEEMLRGQDHQVVPSRVVMIQCVGSRDEDGGYCSRICCGESVKNALRIKELSPESEVFVVYRDLVAIGLAEDYYRKARECGVVFLRWDPGSLPEIRQVSDADGTTSLRVTVTDVSLGVEVALQPDLVVLAAATIPGQDNHALSGILGVPLTQEGFFAEAHPKLRPIQFDRKGVFLCGLAHSPKSARDQVAQATAVATKVSTLLSNSQQIGGTEVAVVEGRCVGCLTCARVCPYGAPHLEGGKSRIDPMVCQGCGICVSQCPASAIQLLNTRSEQLSAQVNAWLEDVS